MVSPVPQSMSPGEMKLVRYWPAHKAAPAGWRDVGSMGEHHWRGKIVAREKGKGWRWTLLSCWRFWLSPLRRTRTAAATLVAIAVLM